MKRSIAIITLIFYIAFFMVLVPIQTYAVLPAVALSVVEAGALETVGSALVAAGLTFAAKEAAEEASEWAWNRLSQVSKDEILSSISNAVDGVVTLTDTVWTELKGLVQTDCSATSTPTTYSSTNDWSGDMPLQGIRYYITDPYATFTDHQEFHTTWIGWTYSSGTKYEFKWVRDGDNISSYRRKMNVIEGTITYDWTLITTRNIPVGNCYWRMEQSTSSVHFAVCILVFPDGYERSMCSYPENPITLSHGETFTYTGADVLTNPTWDFELDGKRKVAIPPVIDNILGNTYPDVIVDGSTCTDGTVIGETPTTSDIDRILDTSTTLNFSPLQVAGTLFTNKFPFSLPWDLKRSFQALSTTNTFNPIFNIAFTAPLIGEVSFDIDLSTFNDLVQKVRVFELISFDVAMILTTRRILGGAT